MVCEMAICEALTVVVEDDGQFPNCSVHNLPVLIYKAAFAVSDEYNIVTKHQN